MTNEARTSEIMLSFPEQHAGSPVTLHEAIESIVALDLVPGVDNILTLGGVEDRYHTASIFVVNGFRAGIASFVQSPSNGRYARIPRTFWEHIDHAADLPLLFPGISNAIGQSEDMIGQPIVIWDGSLDVVKELVLKMAAFKVKATSAQIQQALPFKGKRHRADTSEQKKLHSFFAGLEKVGHLEGSAWNISYAVMQMKYQSIHGPCSPSWFKKWGKRFAEKEW
jgi:hypothetical protein